MSGAFTSRIIRDAGELASIEPQWWDLWRRAPGMTPFQAPAWLLPWWESFSPGALHVAALHKDGRLAGLAPFYLETGDYGPRLLPLGISVSDYLDILLDPDDTQAAAEALAAAMAEAGDWLRWELPELRPGASALALPCPPACQDSAEPGETCPHLPLPAELDALRARLPLRKRRSLSLNRNRAERRGALTFHSLGDSSAEDLLAALIRLHGLRWTRCGETGVLADPRVQAFHERAVPRLAEAGLARLYALRIGEDVAATYYGFLHHGHAYAYLSGFDPGFAFESPGTILIYHAMEEAVREGAREFHFLRGGEAYKYGWGASDRWNMRRVFSRERPDAA
jgi:CelD/BcsL family acetyltransferase involved in cellulose biosynthesis